MSDIAASDEAPIPYIARTRDYYEALGYGAPYQWARLEVVPFSPLRRPLPQARIAIVTTAAPYRPEAGDQGPGAPYNASAKFYAVYSDTTDGNPDLRISHIAIDRDHTTAADIGSYVPLAALKAAASAGRIGSVAARYHGLPTNRSQRATIDVDCVDLVRRVTADGADAVILVPNCPICHQSVCLAAAALEADGIATVIMAAALDIVAHVGAPRAVFTDFPLGNAAGRPHDRASQAATLDVALGLLETARAPRAIVHNQQRWSADGSWKRDYCSLDRLSPDEIVRRRAIFHADKAIAAGNRAAGSGGRRA